MIDADLLLGHYPFRPLPAPSHDLQRIKDYLQVRGIRRACVASLHAVFYADPQQGNSKATANIYPKSWAMISSCL